MSITAHPHPHSQDRKIPVSTALAVAAIASGGVILGVTWQLDHGSTPQAPAAPALVQPHLAQGGTVARIGIGDHLSAPLLPHRTTYRGGGHPVD